MDQLRLSAQPLPQAATSRYGLFYVSLFSSFSFFSVWFGLREGDCLIAKKLVNA
jgi:hypothetical protein